MATDLSGCSPALGNAHALPHAPVAHEREFLRARLPHEAWRQRRAGDLGVHHALRPCCQLLVLVLGVVLCGVGVYLSPRPARDQGLV